MKIALCGPISLNLLSDLVEDGEKLPTGYQYPLAAYLARILHADGHDVACITSSTQDVTSRVWCGDRFSIYHTPRRRRYIFTLDAYAKERAAMLDSIFAYDPDIVHAQWTYEFAHVALDSGFPTLVTARDAPWTIFRHTKSPYRLYRAFYAHYLIPRIKRLSAISEYVAAQIRSEFKYKDEICLIPNGLSKSRFYKKKQRLHIESSPRLISVTGWDPRKNVKTLLRAFALVHSRIPTARLMLIGRGLGKNEAGAKWAHRNELSDGVHFQGAISQDGLLKHLRESADIFVHSTLEESFCMTVLEAMAHSLPVLVLPDSGALPWVVGDGSSGMIADSQSANSLSDAILELIKNSGKRLDLAASGYARARSLFELESVAKQYVKEYQKTIQYYARKN